MTSELITGAGFSEVRYATAESAIEDIVAYAQDGDIVMTVGAGDVTALGARLLESLEIRHGGELKKSEA